MCFFFVILNLPVTFFAHKFLTFPLFVLKFLVNSLGSSGCFGFEFLNKKIAVFSTFTILCYVMRKMSLNFSLSVVLAVFLEF